MISFVRRTFLFVLPVMVCFIIGEMLLRSIPNDYARKRSIMDANAASFKVLILGNSHAYYGINPTYLSVPAFNAGNVSQSIDFDRKLLLKYIDRMDSLKCVVVVVSSYSLFHRLEEGLEPWRAKNYRIYFGLETDSYLNTSTEIIGNRLSVNSDRLISYYLQGRTEVTSSIDGWGSNFTADVTKDIEATGTAAARRHTKRDRSLAPINIGYLKEISRTLEPKGVRIIFVTLPAYRSYWLSLDKEQWDSTRAAMLSIVAQHPNAQYVDMLNDDRFTAGDFYDGDHLNDRGAAKFSRILNGLIMQPEARPASPIN